MWILDQLRYTRLCIRRQRTHLRSYKLWELVKVCCYWKLSSLGVIETTQTFDRIRLFQNERFSDAFLVSHGINQRQRCKNTHVVALDTCNVAFSPLHLVSSFWLSGHLFFDMQFISKFIWVNVRWNGPTWQAKTIISYFAINSHWKSTSQET